MLEAIYSAFPSMFRPQLEITIRAGQILINHPDAPFDLHQLQTIGQVLIGEDVIEIHY